jgi:adenylate cyclase
MTPDNLKRKLTTILSADVKGYSRLMGEDEEWTLRTLNTFKGLIRNLVGEHRGRVVTSSGDNVLAEFASVVDAVECAVETQQVLRAKNALLPEARKMEFRIGINLGDVIEDEDSIYGDGVNIAARLEGLADPGGICISGSAYEQIENKIPLYYDYLGEHEVKNIAKPVRVYRARIEPEAAPSPLLKEKKPLIKRLSPAVLVGSALVLIAAVAVLYQFVFRPSSTKIEVASKEKMAYPLPAKPSIAVLPFSNLSGDPKQEFFSDGITEGIITALSKNPNLFVIARNSTFTYKGKPVKVKQVSEDLGVHYVLEGSVQRSGDRVRITAQLIDALSGHHLWSERYDRELKDIFALQDEVTLKMLMATQVYLTKEDQTRWNEKYFKGKQGIDFYLKVLEADYYRKISSIESVKMSKRIAEEIVTRWPKRPDGYFFLANVYYCDRLFGTTKFPQESLEKAMKLTQKALALDNSVNAAHWTLSAIYSHKKEYEKAIAEGERCLALDPDGYVGNAAYAYSLWFASRWEEAIPVFQKLILLDPLASSDPLNAMGVCYSFTGRLEEAFLAWKQALQQSPNFYFPHLNKADAYIRMGRAKEARAEATEVLRINPRFSLDNYEKFCYAFKDQLMINKYIGNLRKAGLK